MEENLPNQLPETADTHPLVCEEVWGGTQRVARTVELPGLSSWVSSTPFEESIQGGDIYYLSACDQGLISRVTLADVSGHGTDVAAVSEQLLQLIRRHINTWDQSDLMRGLDSALGGDTRDSQYATAVVLGYFLEVGQLVFTLAGHPKPLWLHARENRWEFLEHDTARPAPPLAELPLGLISGTSYRQTVVNLELGDLVILYTDALLESTNREGDELGFERLLELAKALPTTSPADAGRALLAAVRDFRLGNHAEDDETLIVLTRPREGSAVSQG